LDRGAFWYGYALQQKGYARPTSKGTTMGSIRPPNGEGELTIDFKSTQAIRTLALKDQLDFGAVVLVRGTSQPIEGFWVRSPQVTVAIHESETFRMDWRSAESDRLHSNEIARGHAHVGDGRLPFWFRSRASPSFFAIAMDVEFVKHIWEMEFDRGDNFELRTAICVHDLVIDRIGLLGREELSEGGIGGRLYGESLGAALAVHILRHYGTSPRAPAIHKGGLASRPLKRVIEYINEHLQDELSLVELSRIAKLSPHHFATGFKASTGISPHSYVIERRISRARDLLLRKEKSISEIALAVGFSSQSHLTANFRRTTGVTPRKFRDSLD
jgi:AraC family transcriptional regulator